MDRLLYNLEKYILLVLIFITPLTFFYISPNPFVVSKLAVLVFGLVFLVIVKSIRVIYEGKLQLSISNYDFPVFLLGVAYIASTLLRTPNKMEALLLPGVATYFVGSVLIFFLINQLKEADKKLLQVLFLVSASIHSLFILMASAGVFNAIPQLPAFVKLRTFTPEGGYLPSAIFMLVLLPLGVGLIVGEKEAVKKILYSVATFLILAGLGLALFYMIPGKPHSPRFPSMQTSWSIAIDALKQSPIFGTGPGNYLTSFNRFRPVNYNLTDLWALKFTTASNLYLAILTDAGLLGFTAILLIIYAFYKTARKDLKEQKLVNWGFGGIANMVSLGLMILALAVFPGSLLVVLTFFILLALNSKTHQTHLALTSKAEGTDLASQAQSRFPAFIIAIPFLLIAGFSAYRASIILSAEYKFKNSLDALSQNKASETYNLMRDAIALNPRVDRYHSTFSRVNLILANAITRKVTASTEGQEVAAAPQLTEQDRTDISNLIQQAIQSGKASVAVNQLRAENWQILASTYQSIIPFAQGADVFAVQTYRQAVALDPMNPNLRIALGGIYYAAKDYDTAISIFTSAVSAKSDLANAHYNLAYAYREKGDLAKAAQEMALVLSLVDPKSQDYEVAQKTLSEIQEKQKLTTETQPTDNLTPPQEAQEPAIEPQLELPQDSQPPEAPITPTPTRSPSADDKTQSTPSPTIIP